jgi:GST-like protein
LIYLAEKTGKFLAPSGALRAKTLQWLAWQVAGVGPTLGQANHFNSVAPKRIEYAINRFTTEAQRLFMVMNRQLADHPYIVGNAYSIADIALYPWIVPAWAATLRTSPNATSQWPGIGRWLDDIGRREGVKAGMALP